MIVVPTGAWRTGLGRINQGLWSHCNTRRTTCRTVNIAAATRQLARQPDITLDLLGIPPLLCK